MSYARRVRREMLTRCVHLCTKRGAFPLPADDDPEPEFDTAIWWCAATTEALGPDGSSAAPDTCGGPGRQCYEPPAPAG